MLWFKHDVGAFKDERIQALRIELGGAAVDVYYAIIELIYERETNLVLNENQAETKSFLFWLCLGFDRFSEFIDVMENLQLLTVERDGDDGNVTLTIGSARAKREIDKATAKSETLRQNARKGGRPSKSKANGNQKVSDENQKQSKSPKDYKTIRLLEKDVSKDTSKSKAPDKHHYGEFANVLLSDAEMESLRERFPDDWQRRIDDLSYYLGSTGKSYKSHYRTILNWARQDGAKAPVRREVRTDARYAKYD